MPTRNVNLTDELDRFVATRIENGRYESASEVVRAALRTLEREEREYEANSPCSEPRSPKETQAGLRKGTCSHASANR